MKTEKRKSVYKEVPADRHACCQFTRGLGTPRTRQLSKSYTTGEIGGRVSAALCDDSTRCGAISRCSFPAGPATPAAFYSHRSRDRDRNPPRRSHKSDVVSIVAMHSWRPRWVKGGHAKHVAAATGSPQTADQLAVGQRDGGELMPARLLMPPSSWRDQRQREGTVLADLKAERAALGAKGRQIETESAPIRYVAELVGADSERAIRWL